jgi:hypothetical protein
MWCVLGYVSERHAARGASVGVFCILSCVLSGPAIPPKATEAWYRRDNGSGSVVVVVVVLVLDVCVFILSSYISYHTNIRALFQNFSLRALKNQFD